MKYNGGKTLIIVHIISVIDHDGTLEVHEWSVFGIRMRWDMQHLNLLWCAIM